MNILLALILLLSIPIASAQSNPDTGPLSDDPELNDPADFSRDEGPIPMQRQDEDLSKRGPSGDEAMQAVEELQLKDSKEEMRKKQKGE